MHTKGCLENRCDLSKVLCRLFCVFAWRSASAVKLLVAKTTKCPLNLVNICHCIYSILQCEDGFQWFKGGAVANRLPDFGVGLRIKQSSVRIQPWPLRWVLGQGSLLPLSQGEAFTLASISYLAILVKYILAKKKKRNWKITVLHPYLFKGWQNRRVGIAPYYKVTIAFSVMEKCFRSIVKKKKEYKIVEHRVSIVTLIHPEPLRLTFELTWSRCLQCISFSSITSRIWFMMLPSTFGSTTLKTQQDHAVKQKLPFPRKENQFVLASTVCARSS